MPPAADEFFDVAIVGYGPVGATAANLFGTLGWRTAVLETAASVYHLPRAAHFDAEIMRVFQAVGLSQAVQTAVTPVRGMHFLNAAGEKLFGYDAPEGPTAQHWPSGYMFYQPDLERALRAGVAERPSVEVHLEHEVLGFTQHPDHVAVRVRDLARGEERCLRARYLVGCDGARSIVRREAGLELEDLGFDQAWLVVDTVLRRHVPLPEICLQVCDPARPTTFIPSAGAHRRWEFMLMPGEDPAAMQRDEWILRLLGPWVGDDGAEILRAAVYSFHALVARRWRSGRVLLAGDSCHQMPPFLGQGMCSGIRDASNLAWRLDLVLSGRAGDDLLDGYDVERAPHVRAITEFAVAVGRIIQTTDPAVAAARDAQVRAGSGPPVGEYRMPPLRGALVVPRTGDAADVAGTLFPQGRVRTNDGSIRLLDDVLGLRFALVSLAAAKPAPALSPLLTRLGAHAIAVMPRGSAPAPGESGSAVVEDLDGLLVPWLEKHGSALVRPDRYVIGTAGSPADAARWDDALARAVG